MAILFNKLVSKTKWVIERTIGSIKRWFGTGKARYKELSRIHAQHLIMDIEHNLYRFPAIIISCS
ncbi:MAG: transposase [Flavobacteriales bacterium Tduv]